MAEANLDSFTVPGHSPNGRHLPAIKAVSGDCQWPLQTMAIPTSYLSHNTISSKANATYILTNQVQKSDASQLDSISHTPLIVWMPAG